jgi:tetratricopeptide (TPR) repeat protein
VARWFGKSRKAGKAARTPGPNVESESGAPPADSRSDAVKLLDEDPLTAADALRLGYGRTGDPAMLLAAVKAMELARDRYPADDPQRASPLSGLCMLSRLRWQRERDPRLLQQAVEYGRQAVAVAWTGDPEMGRHLAALGTALEETFRYGDQLGDIDEAVAVHRRCLDLIPLDHPDRLGQESNLANALVLRGVAGADHALLEEGIERTRAALRDTPADDPAHPARLANVAAALAAMALTGSPHHLAEAQALYEQALREFPPRHPARAGIEGAVRNIHKLRQARGS